MTAARLAIDLHLAQVLGVVVIRRHLGIVGNVERLGILVLTGGMRVGQRLLSQGRNTGGLIMLVALVDLFPGAGRHFLAFIAAGPIDGIYRHAFVLITAMGFDHRHGRALGAGQYVAAFSENQGRAEAGDQKQNSTVHRDFLSSGALPDQGAALIKFRKHDGARGSIRF